MTWYKIAKETKEDIEKISEVITGPDMPALTPNKKEMILDKLKENFPQIYDKVSQMADVAMNIHQEHFSVDPKPFTGPKDKLH